MSRLAWLLPLCLSLYGPLLAQEPVNLLANPSFEEPPQANGGPAGWSIYGGLDENRRLTPVDGGYDGPTALLMDDDDPARELGVTQSVAGEGGVVYRAGVWVKAAPAGNAAGSYLQLRFLPSNTFHQIPLIPHEGGSWRERKVAGFAPADTTRVVVYLYCHAQPTPKIILDQASLIIGGDEEDVVAPPPEPPVIDHLKDLHLTTALVANGQPAAAIVAPAGYAAEATRLNAAIAQAGGSPLPLVAPDEALAEIPLGGLYESGLTRNLICLGNRSTNPAISRLYDQYYTLLDLKYPGPGGWVLRSLHDPFGDGHNVLFCGGSDLAGVGSAVNALIQVIGRQPAAAGTLAVGRLMEIHLPQAYTIPQKMAEVGIWDASDGYRSSGYFGWNSISKRMALYYMTGDEASAREVIRLAFPDQATKDELAATDGEMIENKDAPLSGPYHYNAHLMAIFWDLIEESPVFTDAERLKVTNALAQQLRHRVDEGIYNRTEPPSSVGSRHGQWSAVSLYCLGRYLQKSYPDPVWRHCVRSAQLHFDALKESSWVAGESDNLFWYNTATAPMLVYMILSGEREPLTNGVIPELLQGQEALISGQTPDWALRYAAISYLNQAAYLTGDGRWLTYLGRTQNDLDEFRLGQSFWPAEITPQEAADRAGHWTIQPLPRPLWYSRASGLPYEESYFFGSYRDRTDAGGDFILLDGFNGASRNPYHCFAILELRIAGRPVLQATNGAYLNQVQTKADGLVAPRAAMDSALRSAGVTGEMITAVGEVPNASFANWRRTLAQRRGRYALVVDDLTWQTDSQHFEVATSWQTRGLRWDAAAQALAIPVGDAAALPAGWQRVLAREATLRSEPTGSGALLTIDPYGIKLLRSTELGQWLEMSFILEQPFTGTAWAELLNYTDRGEVSITLDGQTLVDRYNHHSGAVESARVSLGRQQLAAGEHTLRVTVVGRSGQQTNAFIGLNGLSLQPDGASMAAPGTERWAIRAADPLTPGLSGDVATQTWRGAGQSGEHWINFNLIAPDGTGDDASACLRLAPNAAVLKTPAPAVASVGEYGVSRGDLVVVGPDHLFALQATAAGLDQPLLTATAPVTADWDFAAGRLSLSAAEPATVQVAAAAGELTLDGQPLATRPVAGRVEFALPAGDHEVAVRPALTVALEAALAEGDRQRAAALADADQPAPELPALSAGWAAAVEGKPVAVETGGDRIYVAVERAVQVFDSAGQPLATWPTDGPIRVLHWWPEPGLLVAGCTDEQVIAFGPDGARQWVFTSVMDPAVFQAAKQYWFKSAPGHEGIHGLASGAFIDGQSQLFVGSACTLEILNPDGSLAKRLPVFWGPGNLFRLIDGPEGEPTLLVGRSPNDSAALAMVDATKLSGTPRGFLNVPAGHTFVGAWSAQNRSHLFYTDLDGDGVREVVGEINGTWNRVTIWSARGEALASANFGPGPKSPARTVRSLDVADLDGNGTQEIVVALADGTLIALDHQCERVWSTRLPSPATALAAWRGRILCALDNGQVLQLDAHGTMTQTGTVPHPPVALHKLDNGQALIATQAGELQVFGP